MKKGFTLIELLVVIAIIAILAAILFPVFAKAREKARQTTCTSNQKQIATAVMMYTQENDEKLPGDDIWSATGLSGKILQCPTAGKKIAIAYGYNGNLIDKGLGEFQNPVETLLSCDAENADKNILTVANVKAGSITPRHAGKPIAAYLDTHVVLLPTAVAGFIINDLAITEMPSDTDDLTTFPALANWKFYSGGAWDQNPIDIPINAPVLAFKASTQLTTLGQTAGPSNVHNDNSKYFSFVENKDGVNGISVAPRFGAAFYTFPDAVSGSFGLDFDMYIPADGAKGIIAIFDSSNKAIFSMGFNGGSRFVVFDSYGNGWDCNTNYGVRYKFAENGTPQAKGLLHVKVIRDGSKITCEWSGDYSAKFSFPGGAPYPIDRGDKPSFTFANSTSAMKSLLVNNCNGTNIRVGNITVSK